MIFIKEQPNKLKRLAQEVKEHQAVVVLGDRGLAWINAIILLMDYKEQSAFIPIDEVRSEKVRFEIDLPKYIPSREIGVHLRRVNRLWFIAGMSHLRVTTTNSEDQEETRAIMGFNSSGEAYAGAAKAKQKPLFSTDASPDQMGSRSSWLAEKWIQGTIKIDMDAAVKRINGDRRYPKGVRDPEAWSKIIDSSLRQGINNLGVNHLVFGGDVFDKALLLLDMLAGTSISTEPLYGIPHTPNPETFLSNTFLSFLISNLTVFCLITLDHPGERRNRFYRPSLFVGTQLDWALALKILNHQKLAKRLEVSSSR